MRLELPEVTAKRGGIKFGEAHIPPKPPRAPLPPAPEGAGEGRWLFGIQSDEVVHDSWSAWLSGEPGEKFTSPEEALEFWGELEDGEKIVRRWVPRALPWEDHS